MYMRFMLSKLSAYQYHNRFSENVLYIYLFYMQNTIRPHDGAAVSFHSFKSRSTEVVLF